MRYFVGYVSKTGTTKEIAERIGEVLRTKGEEADVSPLAAVGGLEGYDKLVLGSPVNGMQALPEFKDFLAHRAAGSGKPVELFLVSYLYPHGRSVWKNAVRKDAAACCSLTGAKNAAIFGGRLEKALPGFARLIFGTPKDLPLDLRDWDKIEAWVGELAGRA